ncbi:MAG: putative amidotransferase [Candidatus Tokpelaia sp. JSC189]|nr:MAG: putative amidotransferase [Candidatus Tokpelaia sp. JSC189]
MLRDEITNSLNIAIKEQNKLRLSTLRFIDAAVKDRDVANREEGRPPTDDTELRGLLVRMIKQREESAKMYDDVGRNELASDKRCEIAVIREFLPSQLDPTEMQAAIEEAIIRNTAEGLRDMGKVMSWLKKHYIGKMDFSRASICVQERLK